MYKIFDMNKNFYCCLLYRIVGSNKSEFALRVPMEAQRLANSPHLPSLLEEKKLRMTDEWLNEVEAHRHQELQKMKINFCDLSYHQKVCLSLANTIHVLRSKVICRCHAVCFTIISIILSLLYCCLYNFIQSE